MNMSTPLPFPQPDDNKDIEPLEETREGDEEPSATEPDRYRLEPHIASRDARLARDLLAGESEATLEAWRSQRAARQQKRGSEESWLEGEEEVDKPTTMAAELSKKPAAPYTAVISAPPTGAAAAAAASAEAAGMEEVDEEDPLDAFMRTVQADLDKAAVATKQHREKQQEEIMDRLEDLGHADAADFYQQQQQTDRKRRLETAIAEENDGEEEALDDGGIEVAKQANSVPTDTALATAHHIMAAARASKHKILKQTAVEEEQKAFVPEEESEEEEDAATRGRKSGTAGLKAAAPSPPRPKIPTGFDWAQMTSERQRVSRLPEIPKCVYAEASNVTAESFEDVAQFRKDLQISTSGLNVPKCISEYEDLEPTLENFDPIDPWLRFTFNARERAQILPEAIECQLLPVAFVGRDIHVTAPPPYHEGDLLSGQPLIKDHGIEGISFCLYAMAVSVLARITAAQRAANINRWQHQPIVLLICSSDERAEDLYYALRQHHIAAQKRPASLRPIAHTTVQAMPTRDPQIELVQTSKYISQQAVAGTADIVVGSAEAIVGLWSFEQADMLPLEEVYLTIFADIGGPIEFDPALASVILQQTRENKQIVAVSSTNDTTVDQFFKEQMKRPIRIKVQEKVEEQFRMPSGIEHRFLTMAAEENKANWLVATVTKFLSYGRVIIFCSSDRRCEDIAGLMRHAAANDLVMLSSKDCEVVGTEASGFGSPLKEMHVTAAKNFAPLVIAMTPVAMKLLRRTAFAGVVVYDLPRSVDEFCQRCLFASKSALKRTPQQVAQDPDAKARIYTLFTQQQQEANCKMAAYIAEAFTAVGGRKTVPKAIDDLAFRYTPYRQSVLECKTLPAERPVVTKSTTFAPRRRAEPAQTAALRAMETQPIGVPTGRPNVLSFYEQPVIGPSGTAGPRILRPPIPGIRGGVGFVRADQNLDNMVKSVQVVEAPSAKAEREAAAAVAAVTKSLLHPAAGTDAAGAGSPVVSAATSSGSPSAAQERPRKRRRTANASSSSSSSSDISDEDDTERAAARARHLAAVMSASGDTSGVSAILRTEELRRRREANLAAFKAQRAASDAARRQQTVDGSGILPPTLPPTSEATGIIWGSPPPSPFASSILKHTFPGMAASSATSTLPQHGPPPVSQAPLLRSSVTGASTVPAIPPHHQGFSPIIDDTPARLGTTESGFAPAVPAVGSGGGFSDRPTVGSITPPPTGIIPDGRRSELPPTAASSSSRARQSAGWEDSDHLSTGHIEAFQDHTTDESSLDPETQGKLRQAAAAAAAIMAKWAAAAPIK